MPESKTKTHRNLTKSISLHTQFICDLYPAVSAMGEFGTTGGNAIHSLNPLLCAVKIQERVPSRAEQEDHSQASSK